MQKNGSAARRPASATGGGFNNNEKRKERVHPQNYDSSNFCGINQTDGAKGKQRVQPDPASVLITSSVQLFICSSKGTAKHTVDPPAQTIQGSSQSLRQHQPKLLTTTAKPKQWPYPNQNSGTDKIKSYQETLT